MTGVEALLVFIGLIGVGIWMIVDPTISALSTRGPQTLAACRAGGVLAVLLGSWGTSKVARVLLRDRDKKQIGNGS